MSTLKQPSIQQSTIDFVAGFEGLRCHAYQDQHGIWTIGYGTTHPDGKAVKPHSACTLAQAKAWLGQDLEHAAQAVTVSLHNHQLTQHQFDACVDFCYNLGTGTWFHSSLPVLIDEGHINIAANNLLNYDHVDGQSIEGLKRRREAERALLLS